MLASSEGTGRTGAEQVHLVMKSWHYERGLYDQRYVVRITGVRPGEPRVVGGSESEPTAESESRVAQACPLAFRPAAH